MQCLKSNLTVFQSSQFRSPNIAKIEIVRRSSNDIKVEEYLHLAVSAGLKPLRDNLIRASSDFGLHHESKIGEQAAIFSSFFLAYDRLGDFCFLYEICIFRLQPMRRQHEICLPQV
jgi:hypothetical protein